MLALHPLSGIGPELPTDDAAYDENEGKHNVEGLAERQA